LRRRQRKDRIGLPSRDAGGPKGEKDYPTGFGGGGSAAKFRRGGGGARKAFIPEVTGLLKKDAPSQVRRISK